MARIFRLLQLIQGGACWNVAQIAAELECSERTVHRDLNVLELLGVPYYFDQDRGGYAVRPGWQFPMLPLTSAEALDFAVATVLSQAPGLNIAVHSLNVSRKLAAKSGQAIQELLSDAERLISVMNLKLADHSQHRDTIKTIQWALLNRQQLMGHYASPYQHEPANLVLHPLRLCLVRQAWYLIASVAEDYRTRTYRVTRFKSLRATDKRADVPMDFNLQDYFGNAWSVYRGAATYEVEIEFDKSAAAIVTETLWHSTQQVKRHRDGRVTLTFRVDGLEEIVWWVLGWSGRAKVIKPTKLRQLVVEKLQVGLALQETE